MTRLVCSTLSALALALATGCSPVKGLNDAGGDDDDDDVIDASAGPDVAWVRGTVQVQVLGPDGAPMPGARVVFNEPDGSVASTQLTDGAGRASAELYPTSSVTVAFSTGDESTFDIRNNLRTVLGVMPGDDITIGLRREGVFTSNYLGDVRMEINVTFSGASNYELRIGCDSFFAGGVGRIDWQIFESTCNGGLTPVDVLATARNDANDVLAFSTHLGVPLNSASYVPINSWRTDWDRFSIQLQNPPAEMSYAISEMSLWRRGLDYRLFGENSAALDGTSGATFDLLFPPSFAEGLTPRVIAVWGEFPTGVNGMAQVVRKIAPTDDELTIDLSNDLLPRIFSATFNGSPDLTDAEIDYEIAGVPDSATAGAGSLQWEQTIPGDGGNPDTFVDWEWFFIMPPDTASPIQLPDLPFAALPGTWPPPEDAAHTSTVVGVLETNLREGWDEFRQANGFGLLDDEDSIGPESPNGSFISLSIGGLLGFD